MILHSNTKRKFGLFVSTQNQDYPAGNVRLFHKDGPIVHHYMSFNPEGFLQKTWYFWFVAIYLQNLQSGRSHWSIRFMKIQFQREYMGFSIRLKLPDRYAFFENGE